MTATTKTWIERAAFAAVVVFVLVEWHASHKALKDTETKISQTEKARASEVKTVDAAVKVVRANVKAARTPVAKVGLITKLAALPLPLEILGNVSGKGAGKDGAASPQSLQDAVIPKADIQPLLNFSSECAVCKLKLASDETQIKQLEGERDSALQTAKGGSFWRRTKSAAKFIGIGVAIGVTVGVVAARK